MRPSNLVLRGRGAELIRGGSSEKTHRRGQTKATFSDNFRKNLTGSHTKRRQNSLRNAYNLWDQSGAAENHWGWQRPLRTRSPTIQLPADLPGRLHRDGQPHITVPEHSCREAFPKIQPDRLRQPHSEDQRHGSKIRVPPLEKAASSPRDRSPDWKRFPHTAAGLNTRISTTTSRH